MALSPNDGPGWGRGHKTRIGTHHSSPVLSVSPSPFRTCCSQDKHALPDDAAHALWQIIMADKVSTAIIFENQIWAPVCAHAVLKWVANLNINENNSGNLF